ncbi:DUF3618 domain-containing protein [Sphingomonas sp. ID0503]|uniref:DUF3618 domain-containing protein n=1 Tax=Sphingomonas sp. ID0503 TaxID=3399691 RepID=UPI003AFB78B8
MSEYVQAKRDAERARARLTTTLAELKARLNPAAFAEDQLDMVKTNAVKAAGQVREAVAARPAVAAAGAGLLLAFLFRKSIGRGIAALRGKDEEPDLPLPPPPRATSSRRTT